MRPPLDEFSCPDSDIALMRRVQAGDLDAFERLARNWRPALLRFFSSLTTPSEDAEDCVQATLIRLWRARERYSPCGKFSTYLFQIAKRYWLNERERKTLPQEPLEAVSETLPGLTFRDFNHPEGHLLARYRRDRVWQAVRLMPEKQRLALILCHFEGLSQREAAEVLDLPLGTVKSRLNAAFVSLRRLLGDLVEE